MSRIDKLRRGSWGRYWSPRYIANEVVEYAQMPHEWKRLDVGDEVERDEDLGPGFGPGHRCRHLEVNATSDHKCSLDATAQSPDAEENFQLRSFILYLFTFLLPSPSEPRQVCCWN